VGWAGKVNPVQPGEEGGAVDAGVGSAGASGMPTASPRPTTRCREVSLGRPRALCGSTGSTVPSPFAAANRSPGPYRTCVGAVIARGLDWPTAADHSRGLPDLRRAAGLSLLAQARDDSADVLGRRAVTPADQSRTEFAKAHGGVGE
jgi:hypothetical protein